MKILILGGTRLLGKKVVKTLLNAGHDLTVISRKKEVFDDKVTFINADRSEGIKKLAGNKYDYTLDFIAFDANSPAEVFNNVMPGVYVLISTVWMVKIGEDMSADSSVDTAESLQCKQLPALTRNYILGKKSAEEFVMKKREEQQTATVLRLPIFWDKEEHTQRLQFYCSRVVDGFPVMLVNGGRNKSQIAWGEDVALAIRSWIESDIAIGRSIWEALPGEGIEVRRTIQHIAELYGKSPVFENLTSDVFEKDFPEYLDEEPLWRENEIAITDSNLFRHTGINPTEQKEWLRRILPDSSTLKMSGLRHREIELIEGRNNA